MAPACLAAEEATEMSRGRPDTRFARLRVTNCRPCSGFAPLRFGLEFEHSKRCEKVNFSRRALAVLSDSPFLWDVLLRIG